jgi:hypothetical protein
MKATAWRHAGRARSLDHSASQDGRIVMGFGVTGSIGSSDWTPRSETWSVQASPDQSLWS